MFYRWDCQATLLKKSAHTELPATCLDRQERSAQITGEHVQRLTGTLDQHGLLIDCPAGHVLYRPLLAGRLVLSLMVMQAIEDDVARLGRHLLPAASIDRALDCSPGFRFALVVVVAPAVAASSPSKRDAAMETDRVPDRARPALPPQPPSGSVDRCHAKVQRLGKLAVCDGCLGADDDPALCVGELLTPTAV